MTKKQLLGKIELLQSQFELWRETANSNIKEAQMCQEKLGIIADHLGKEFVEEDYVGEAPSDHIRDMFLFGGLKKVVKQRFVLRDKPSNYGKSLQDHMDSFLKSKPNLKIKATKKLPRNYKFN
jgi:hypothetical protein